MNASAVQDASQRVLHVVAEVYPLVKTGGLGDIAAALPAAQRAQGADARLLVPGYPVILDGARGLQTVADLGAVMGAGRVRLLLGTMPDSGVPVYVLDAPWYFRRSGNPYLGEDAQDWYDNPQRFALLGWVGAQLAWGGVDLDWEADILHAHDWHAGLAPVYLRTQPVRRLRSVFSVHNIAFQGYFPLELGPQMGLPPWALRPGGVEFYGQGNFMKGGLAFADWLSTVSPSYAQEITTPAFGYGMEGILFERRHQLTGILNGIDESVWNPSADPELAATYSADNLFGKIANKTALQQAMGLDVNPNRLVAVMVSRLTDQKGADLVLAALPRMKQLGIQFALLGSGDRGMQDAFVRAAQADPGSVAVRIGYDERLSHRLVAGGDIILVPSRFEPCGLTQMYGLRYGTLPLVRSVGGLADTVRELEVYGRQPNGFVFTRPDVGDFSLALERAAVLWRDSGAWQWRMRQAMHCQHGWAPASAEYLALYRQVLARQERGR